MGAGLAAPGVDPFPAPGEDPGEDPGAAPGEAPGEDPGDDPAAAALDRRRVAARRGRMRRTQGRAARQVLRDTSKQTMKLVVEAA